MRFRIPPQLKETITVVRKSAFEQNSEAIIAADVSCLIVPKTDIVRVIDGVGMSDVEWVALLETPNTDICDGDVLRRADETELHIRRVRSVGTVLQLELKVDADIVL